MDALPGELNLRIRQEARDAGLRDEHSPSIEMVERRRLQLWVLTLIVVTLLGAAMLVASAGHSAPDWLRTSPWVLRGAVLALAIGFCVYALEKEVHLHRLSRLLVDERVVSSALSKRLEMSEALAAAGKALNSVLDLDEVLDAILANALRMFRGASGSVMLLEDEDQLRVVAVRGGTMARDARVRIGESIAGQAARARQPVLVNGSANSGDYPGYVERIDPAHSSICAPLEHRGQLLGVLNVSALPGHDFDEFDLQILSLFAEPVAAAIAKAGLYEAERAHVAELLEQDQLRNQFVASVSHELRTPLTSIRGAVAASRRAVDAAQRVELLDVVERQSIRLQTMIEELLTTARMDRRIQRTLARRVDVAALVRLAALDAQVAGRPVEVDAPEECDVHADPEAVRRIVGNLIENAHKYGRPPVRVTIQPFGDQVVLSVVDHGLGVPAPERERVFERFHRLDPNGTKPGMGLGLAIVRGLVEASQGRVWVEDGPGGGAAFRVVLPSPVGSVQGQEVVHAG